MRINNTIPNEKYYTPSDCIGVLDCRREIGTDDSFNFPRSWKIQNRSKCHKYVRLPRARITASKTMRRPDWSCSLTSERISVVVLLRLDTILLLFPCNFFRLNFNFEASPHRLILFADCSDDQWVTIKLLRDNNKSHEI